MQRSPHPLERPGERLEREVGASTLHSDGVLPIPACVQLSAGDHQLLKQIEEAERIRMDNELQQDLALQEGALRAQERQRNKGKRHRTHRY